jgi:hypothetical protein
MKKKHQRNKKTGDIGSKSERKETFNIGYYCLAFIDILNQKEALRNIHELPETEQEKEEFLNRWRKAFGIVDVYRSSFDSFFKSHLSPAQIQLPNLDREKNKLMRRFLNYEVRKQLFSDTMIYYVSMMDHPERLAIIGIYTLLMACAGTFLVTLSDGLICRGGIEAGVAGEFFNGEIYGPALYHAHRLESEVAKYPRITIGSKFCQYIEAELGNPGQSSTDQYRQTMAQKCKNWLSVDVDEVPILDYAGNAARTTFPQSAELVDNSPRFVDAEWDKFKREGNVKLAERYSLLHNYLVSCKNEVWQ